MNHLTTAHTHSTQGIPAVKVTETSTHKFEAVCPTCLAWGLGEIVLTDTTSDGARTKYYRHHRSSH